MTTRNPRVRTPHDHSLVNRPVDELLEQWSWTRSQIVLCELLGDAGDPADYFTELALGTRIAAQIASGRWCIVARLLQQGTAESWRSLASALNLDPAAAREGFRVWVSEQVELYRRDGGAFGMDHQEAAELIALADALGIDAR